MLSPKSGEILSLLPEVATAAADAAPHFAAATEVEGYGVEAVREVLLFIISLIGSGAVRCGAVVVVGEAVHGMVCKAVHGVGRAAAVVFDS